MPKNLLQHPPLRLLTVTLTLLAFLVPGILVGNPAVAREPAAYGQHGAIGFANSQRLDEHYDKHGAEFGRVTKQDYLRLAQALRDAPAGGAILETIRRDGVRTRFDRQTGAFLAVNPNGVIRTFFRPNDGERYYRRQAER